MLSCSYTHCVAALALCAIAAWTDVRSGRIPNRLTLTGLGLGLALSVISGGIHGLPLSAVGALVTALVPLLLFRFRAMGGGDVKLFAAIGAIVGAGAGIEIQMAAFVFGALQGMAVWLKNGRLRRGLGQVARFIVPPLFFKTRTDAGAIAAKATEIRFGPAILTATALVVADRLLG
jgi:prepilin peptidase CpaA